MPEARTTTTIPYQLDIEGGARFIYELFINRDGGSGALYETLADWWYVFAIFSFIVSALLLMGTVYAMMMAARLSEQEQEALRAAEHAWRHAHGAQTENAKWQRVMAHVSSENPSDWRLAIMEADIMLDDLLNELGYVGSSIGEKLKGAAPEMFASLQDAWEAHKVRNEIAHKGSDFVLTKRAAQDAVAQYKRVFEEFKFI